MNRLVRVACAAGIACVLTWLPPQVIAQTDVLGILDALDVSQHDDSAALTIKFSVPVHYVRHFPVGEGDVVQITVNAVAVGSLSDEALQRRESLSWTPSRELPLSDVTYEGDGSSGPNLIVRFRHPVKFRVEEGAESRSIIITVISPPSPPEAPAMPQPAPKAAPAAPPPPSMPMLEPVPDSKAEEWMTQGRQAMTENDYAQAIRVFTKVLQHPGHKYLPEAKELLGLARERNKQLAHARAEYEEYLRLYHKARARNVCASASMHCSPLANPARKNSRATKGGGVQAAAGAMTLNGSLSQYYRRDMTNTDQTGTVTTQSSLINYLDIGTRSRGERYDLRSQFTGSYIYDFLPNTSGDDSNNSGVSVSSLYVDASDRSHQLSAKVGRQTRSSGGVLGRFDGGLFTVGVMPKWKLNAVAGAPVDLSANNTVQTNHTLYGMSMDGSGLAEHWDTSVFAIHQTVDGITDRTAGWLRVALFHAQVFGVHAGRLRCVLFAVEYRADTSQLAVREWRRAQSGLGLPPEPDAHNHECAARSDRQHSGRSARCSGQ